MKPLSILLGLALAAVTPLFGASGTATVSLNPQALGTVTFFPIFGDLFVLDTGRMRSYCTNTTGDNLQFDRGFMEFKLPVLPKRIVKATLSVTETRGATLATPVPPDVHEVAVYPADLVIDTADYDEPAELIGTIVTDSNDPPDLRVFTIDVTKAIRQLSGGNVGFRIKLQIDPDSPCVDFAGSDFGDVSIAPPTLQIEFGPRGGPRD
jgi:hypothetical protein